MEEQLYQLQATMDSILEMQLALQAEIAALFLLLTIGMVGIVMYLQDFKHRHTIQDLSKRAFQVVVKQARVLHKTFQNMGGRETTPDALPLLERYVVEHWLATHPRIMEFTESIWLPIIRNGNFTRDDWKPLTERWRSLWLVAQKDQNAKTGKGTALIAARDEIGMEKKLRSILNNSPASHVIMPNFMEKAG